MFKEPRAPHITGIPKVGLPKTVPLPAEHIAKQFGAVHPDNTITGNLTDMYEVQRHQGTIQKADTDVL
jgi:hypothetical protein